MGALGITLGVLCTYERAKWGQKAEIFNRILVFEGVVRISGQEFSNFLSKIVVFIKYGSFGSHFGCMMYKKQK